MMGGRDKRGGIKTWDVGQEGQEGRSMGKMRGENEME